MCILLLWTHEGDRRDTTPNRVNQTEGMIHYIYIPGLGDRFDFLRRLMLVSWRVRGAWVTFVPMRWSDNAETAEQKYTRVAKAIEQASGDEVVLVGESAGGAMVLWAFSRHVQSVDRVVTVCGYNVGAANIEQSRRQHHPAFHPVSVEAEKAVRKLSANDRQRITTIYSTRDTTVTPEHTRIDGAREVVLRTPGHFWSIVYVLIKGMKGA